MTSKQQRIIGLLVFSCVAIIFASVLIASLVRSSTVPSAQLGAANSQLGGDVPDPFPTYEGWQDNIPTLDPVCKPPTGDPPTALRAYPDVTYLEAFQKAEIVVRARMSRIDENIFDLDQFLGIEDSATRLPVPTEYYRSPPSLVVNVEFQTQKVYKGKIGETFVFPTRAISGPIREKLRLAGADIPKLSEGDWKRTYQSGAEYIFFLNQGSDNPQAKSPEAKTMLRLFRGITGDVEVVNGVVCPEKFSILDAHAMRGRVFPRTLVELERVFADGVELEASPVPPPTPMVFPEPPSEPTAMIELTSEVTPIPTQTSKDTSPSTP